jgi:hypothetical protein
MTPDRDDLHDPAYLTGYEDTVDDHSGEDATDALVDELAAEFTNDEGEHLAVYGTPDKFTCTRIQADGHYAHDPTADESERAKDELRKVGGEFSEWLKRRGAA